jgi:hypothetical protein
MQVPGHMRAEEVSFLSTKCASIFTWPARTVLFPKDSAYLWKGEGGGIDVQGLEY